MKKTKKIREIYLYTDGSWRDYLGVGGYAGVILDEHQKLIETVSGVIPICDSSELAEVIAVIETLEKVKSYGKPHKTVKIYTDHICTKDIISSNLLSRYNTIGWKDSRKLKIKKHIKRNLELWKRMYNAMNGMSVSVAVLTVEEKRGSKWHRKCHKLAGEMSNQDDKDFWNVW